MSRFPLTGVPEAHDAAAPLFDKIRQAVGKVPNAYLAIGNHSPGALELLLSGDAVLHRSGLSRQETEAVRLAISAQNGCDYCVAAHHLAGKAARLDADELRRLREGVATGNTKRDALVRFALKAAATRGTVPDAEVQAVLAAGYSAKDVIDVLLVVSLITFTNLVNRVNDTEIDFPIPA